MDELDEILLALISELGSYNEQKTKAKSLRIRKLTQRLSNIGPSVRAELVAADKAGY